MIPDKMYIIIHAYKANMVVAYVSTEAYVFRLSKDNFMYGLSQWETPLDCDGVYYWLHSYPGFSLYTVCSSMIAPRSQDYVSVGVRHKPRDLKSM